MHNILNEAGPSTIFDPAAFRTIRAAALLALRETFGVDHTYGIEFQRAVTQPSRDSVTSALSLLLMHALDDLRASESGPRNQIGLEALLHPVVTSAAYGQFANGHYRDAVLNSVMAVLQLIRDRTGLTIDGEALVTKAFSPNRPLLIVSEDWDSQSGKDEQKGFMFLLQGAVTGVRNPKAHSLRYSPDREVAAQYLVFASLLARQIENATKSTAV